MRRPLRLIVVVVLLIALLPAPAFSSPSARILRRARRLASCLAQNVPRMHIATVGTSAYREEVKLALVTGRRRKPLVYYHPRSTWGVALGVRCAIKHDVKICVRGGGHSWSGASTCSGLVIGTRRMNSMDIRRLKNQVKVEAGLTAGMVLYNLHKEAGRVIPIGTCPSVGIAGFALGGGIGMLSGVRGLLSDNILAMTVVTMDGQVHQDITRNGHKSDLFWGLRGGGGGQLGIVTDMTLKMSEPQTKLHNNIYFAYRWRRDKYDAVMNAWTDYATGDDGQLYMRLVLFDSASNEDIRVAGVCWNTKSVANCRRRVSKTSLWSVAGRTKILMQKSGEGVIEAQKFLGRDGMWGTERPSGPMGTRAELFQRFAGPPADLSDRAWSSTMWDSSMRKSDKGYFRGLLKLIEFGRAKAGMRSIVVEFTPLGKAARSVPNRETAFPHRKATASVAVYYNGGRTKARNALKHKITKYLSPFSSGNYVNYPDMKLSNYKTAYWGSNLDRLRKLKARYDPQRRLWSPQPL